MFRCIAAIPNSGGKCIEHFYPDTPEGHQSAEAFAQQYNRDGWGVYDCVSSLKEQRRAKNAVVEISGLHWDIDARHVSEPKEKIIEKVREKLQALGILTRLVDSGRGVHVYTLFREPIGSDTPDADKAQEILRRVAAHLGADMAPTHFAALMRRPGTNNSKEGGAKLFSTPKCALIYPTSRRISILSRAMGRYSRRRLPETTAGKKGDRYKPRPSWPPSKTEATPIKRKPVSSRH
jgi:hypothetical protein